MSPPEHVEAAVAALEEAGWAEINEAAETSGRSMQEVVRLIDVDELGVVAIGHWSEDEVPRVVHMVRLSELLNARDLFLAPLQG